MAINFPSNPTNGQVFQAAGITYYFKSSSNAWVSANPVNMDLAYANDYATYQAVRWSVLDEGNLVFDNPRRVDFVGAGVTVTNSDANITVSISGGGGGGGGDGTMANDYATWQAAMSNDWSTYTTLTANDGATLLTARSNDYTTWQQAMSNDWSTYTTLTANDGTTLLNARSNDYTTWQQAMANDGTTLLNARSNDYTTWQAALSNDWSTYTTLTANDGATLLSARSNDYTTWQQAMSNDGTTLLNARSNDYTTWQAALSNDWSTYTTLTANDGATLLSARSNDYTTWQQAMSNDGATLLSARANDYTTYITILDKPTFSGSVTVTGNLVVNGSSANDSIYITQTGSGNAIVVASGNVSLNDNVLRRATLRDYALLRVDLGDVTGSTTINLENGNFFTGNTTGATNWTFSNPPSGITAGGFVLELSNGGVQTQTWPSVKWPSGSAPTLTSPGVDVLVFITDDAGTTWRGLLSMKDSK